MRTNARTLTVPLLTLLLAASAAADPAAIVAAKKTLQAGVNAGSAEKLLEARAAFSALAAADPRAAAPHYWIAVASWRAMPILGRTDPERAAAMGEDALRHCEAALAADAKFAEVLALKGGIQGMMIGYGGDMTTLGPQSGANIARAGGMAPENPRIVLLDGIGALHRPRMFGGGAKKALPILEHARELFEHESVADSTAADWGHDDAWLWIGRAHAELEEYAAARDAFRKALEINPNGAWVKFVLLPEVEKKLGGGKKS